MWTGEQCSCADSLHVSVVAAQAQHKGGPRLTCSDVCQDCLQRLLQGLVNSEDLVGLREQLLSALDIDEAAQDMRMQAASSYFISKTWMLGFRRRSSTSTGSKPLEPPTAGMAETIGVHIACRSPCIEDSCSGHSWHARYLYW